MDVDAWTWMKYMYVLIHVCMWLIIQGGSNWYTVTKHLRCVQESECTVACDNDQ